MDQLRNFLEWASLRSVARGIKNWRLGIRWLIRKDTSIINQYLKAHEVRALQIGTGPNPLKAWLNSDLYARDEVIKLDATKPFPLPDQAFNFIYSEHMIEHVPWECGFGMLQECFRIMKPGGVIRIVTPDLNHLIKVTREDADAADQAYVKWYLGHHFPDAALPGNTWLLNKFVRSWGHQFIYDETTLAQTLERAGFQNPTRGVTGTSVNSMLQGLENESRMPPGFLNRESIVMEATKPV
jgi:predicted SAM-dependent methyltransferase